ncbi:MAG: DUF3825 domain-containing protein [Muribaculaceae bacterium]|nr:DUF3825 domain-containing protein [Muribaculaceae bacterium]
MELKEIQKIRECISSCKRDDGWSKMASVGKRMNAQNINIKKMGYNKLKPFFEDLKDYFEVSTDESNLPLVRVKLTDDGKCRVRIQSENKITYLTQWANIDLKTAIESLRKLAIDETWTFGKENEEYPSPILAKYLKWTFVKLMREKKILEENGFAAFNTGLVDVFYKPIYAVFDKNKNQNKQPWHFVGFCVAGSSKSAAARILTDNFHELPKRAIYIQKYDDVMFDTTLRIDVNWEHIILENIERLPTTLLQQICKDIFEISEPSLIQEKEKYYNSLRECLESNPQHLSLISSIMNMAMDVAKLRVEWNYKTAIPIYYPKEDKVHLILPLALNINDPEEISIALVMTKTRAGNYRAVTIFTLDMAYSNARLVTRPSSDWLKIGTKKKDEEETKN